MTTSGDAPADNANVNTAHLPAKPVVNGMPANPSSRNANSPATNGETLPRPCHRDRWVASPAGSRTTETSANAARVVKP